MNYQIKQGDNLWNIVKNNYKLTNNTDIANKVKEIGEANGISDVNKIYADDTIKLVGLDDNEPTETGDTFETSNNTAQDYLKWSSDEANKEKCLTGKGSEIPEFEAFHYDRKELEGKSNEEQIKAYLDKMEPLVQGIIDSVDTADENGQKDGELNFEEYVTLASDGELDLKSLNEASEIIAKYDTIDENNNTTPNGKIEREELAKYVSDVYHQDIDKISSDDFAKYAQELTDLMAKSNINKILKTNFTNLAKMDGNEATISRHEFTAFHITHDIDWEELKKNPTKKVLDVVDGKLNYSVGQSFASDPSNSDYQNQIDYLTNLFNALYSQQQ